MKTSTKILIVVLIALGLLVGFFIGITVDYPKTNKAELAGTIGKMNNYRNVKITENDIQLRSDLLSNNGLLKSYRSFYSFHYTSCVKLCSDLDFAVKAAENETTFREDNSMEIENLKEFRTTLEQARLDLLLAVTTLQNLSEVDQNNLTTVLNNANIAVAQMNYKQKDILAFVEAIEKFVQGNNPSLYTELIKAHDLLTLNQIIVASATNDKPMLKAYDKKQMFSSVEKLNIISSQADLQSAIKQDLGIIGAQDLQIIGSTEKELGIIILSVEKLGILLSYNTEKLGAGNAEKLGAISNSENLGKIIILNTEKLGAILNSDKLGIYNTDKLGALNFEKLGILNTEKLGIE